jgi:peptide/nickel transport system ATP-binding protein
MSDQPMSGQPISGSDAPLLEVRDLRASFHLPEGIVRAVDKVSFSVGKARTLGLIGESGCGKSVTARSILYLVPQPHGRIDGGQVLLHPRDGADRAVDMLSLDPRGDAIRRIRGRDIAMIFQEPMTSFGPMHTIGNQIVEAILLHRVEREAKAARARAVDLLSRVGIPQPKRTVDAYPHQLSGGMRQRAMIAMALSCNPRLLIADEPTTALDVTIQAQILLLLRELRAEFGMAVLFITHNLGVIAEVADDVAVMYLGKIVEQASLVEIFDRPLHPYTQALMKSIPHIEQDRAERLLSIQGSVPDPYDAPPGCGFSTRCDRFMKGVCDQAVPALAEQGSGHLARCFLYSKAAESETPND